MSGLQSADTQVTRGERMARDQRRLAAIVSADVAAYSRRMGGDESGTLAALKAHGRKLFDPEHVDRATYCVNHAQRIS